MEGKNVVLKELMSVLYFECYAKKMDLIFGSNMVVN